MYCSLKNEKPIPDFEHLLCNIMMDTDPLLIAGNIKVCVVTAGYLFAEWVFGPADEKAHTLECVLL